MALLDVLQARAASWEVGSGKAYLGSSAMGLNEKDASKQPETMLESGMDTGHNLRNFDQFCDFMDSRSAQAKALLEDLKLYSELRDTYPDIDRYPEGKQLLENYGARAVMALYGVDESRHKSEFADYAFESGESPYATTSRGFARILGCESRDAGLDDVIERLDKFASDWDFAASQEKFARDCEGTGFDSEPHSHIEYGSGENLELFTPRMAQRYVAEVRGREAFFERCSGCEFSDEVLAKTRMTAMSHDPYVGCLLDTTQSVVAGDFPKFGRRDSGFDSTYTHAFAMDGESIVMMSQHACDDMVASNPKLHYMLDSPACHIRSSAGVSSRGRSTGDLDAAYSDIFGQSSSGLENEGSPFNY